MSTESRRIRGVVVQKRQPAGGEHLGLILASDHKHLPERGRN